MTNNKDIANAILEQLSNPVSEDATQNRLSRAQGQGIKDYIEEIECELAHEKEENAIKYQAVILACRQMPAGWGFTPEGFINQAREQMKEKRE